MESTGARPRLAGQGLAPIDSTVKMVELVQVVQVNMGCWNIRTSHCFTILVGVLRSRHELSNMQTGSHLLCATRSLYKWRWAAGLRLSGMRAAYEREINAFFCVKKALSKGRTLICMIMNRFREL